MKRGRQVELKIVLVGIISFLITSSGLCAQIIADFETPETTPVISTANATVAANPDVSELNPSNNSGYYPKPAGNWKYFTMEFPDTFDIGANNTLKLKVHSSTVGRVYAKFWIGEEILIQSWSHEYHNMPPGNEWVLLQNDISPVKNKEFTKLEIAVGVDNDAAAEVYLDDIILDYVLQPTALHYAVKSGHAFLDSMQIGNDIGEFPSGSSELIESTLQIADSILNLIDEVTDGLVDSTAYCLNDTLTYVETLAITHEHTLIDTLVSHQTVNLYKNLEFIANSKHQLFSMHNQALYGVNEDGTTWYNDGTASKSDLKVVTGSHGALASYDARRIISESYYENEDFRYALIRNYQEGGVNTICWHMDDPKYGEFYWKEIEAKGAYNVVASLLVDGEYHQWYKDQLLKLSRFFKGLRGVKGEAIPVIFRPYHEHTGSWFWWGNTRCTVDEYNQLFRYTMHFLRDTMDVHNLIWAFSPDAQNLSSKEDYYNIYPGDDYTDVFGLDFYFGDSEKEKEFLSERLVDLVENAREKGKLPALTETGNKQSTLNPSDWFSRNLLEAIHANEKTKSIAYYGTWFNISPTNHYVPYPGHASVPDFLRFYDDTTTLFLNDMLEVYDTLLISEVRLPSASHRMNIFEFELSEGTQIEGSNIRVAMPEGEELTNLIANFEVSQGAVSNIDGVPQVSGVSENDFSESVVYTVLSESGNDSLDYEVKIENSLVNEIVVTPEVFKLYIGESYQFIAKGFNQFGYETGVNPSWWVSGGGTIDQNGVFYAEESGLHNVAATVNGISDTVVAYVPKPSPVEISMSGNVLVYPNPASNKVSINSKETIESYSLVDISGRAIFENKYAGINLFSIDIEGLPRGIYIIELRGRENNHQIKLMIE